MDNTVVKNKRGIKSMLDAWKFMKKKKGNIFQKREYCYIYFCIVLYFFTIQTALKLNFSIFFSFAEPFSRYQTYPKARHQNINKIQHGSSF